MARGKTNQVRSLTGKLTRSVGNLSAAALLGSVAALVGAGVVRLIASQLTASYLTLLAIGLLLLLVAAATSYDSIRANLLSRKGFYGFNTVIMILLFLAIASMIIFVGARNNARFDTTASREFSLAKQTNQILKDLDRDVEAIAFFTPTDPLQAVVRGPAMDLLQEYSQVNSKFSYRVIDPEVAPEEARRYGVNPDTQPGSIVFASDNNLQPVETVQFASQGQYVPNSNLERDFSQAILAITRKQQKMVYFLVRHGERDASNAAESGGYGYATRGLEGDNYRADVLDLASEKKVPEDASVLVIAGPQRDLLPEEKAPLQDYLRKGGKAMFLLDPGTPDSYREILRTWGVDLVNGTVVDVANSVADDPRTPLVRRSGYGDPAGIGIASPITHALTDSTFFEHAAAIQPLQNQGKDLQPPKPNVFYVSNNPPFIVNPLVMSTDFFSWSTTDPQSNQFKQGDVRGPLAMGVTIEAIAPFGEQPAAGADNKQKTQIVVIGNSAFATNRFYTSFGNGDLFLNSINWLAGDVELISVRPKLIQPRILIVTQGTFDFIRWSSWLFLPLGAAAAGAFVWWRRR